MPDVRGVRLPAEWEPQSAAMLTWPHADTDWADRLDAVLPVFGRIGAEIARRQPLLSVCRDTAHAGSVRQHLLAAGADDARLCFAFAASNDSWARDHGPLTTLHGRQARLNDYDFNGWGGRFDAALDTQITGTLVRDGVFGDTPLHDAGLVLEGGAIESDGQGTLLATRRSLVCERRNPGLSRADIEARLADQLGFTRFLWLDHGAISGDDTDGHIDTLARFADAHTIVYATAPPGDADHAALAAMEAELQTLRRADGAPYALRPLPFPGVHRDDAGRRLPAGYANFLCINGAVLLPAYGVDADAAAVALLRQVFADRDIVAIDCREIIRQNGSLHCLTMQFPAPLRVDCQPLSPAGVAAA
ncbi:MAG: agmatine deiminase family protein [Gammaproteobacteria bacterium]|nr:agmatine deiminase family protein [Gammaproteobacteria bacterium]